MSQTRPLEKDDHALIELPPQSHAARCKELLGGADLTQVPPEAFNDLLYCFEDGKREDVCEVLDAFHWPGVLARADYKEKILPIAYKAVALSGKHERELTRSCSGRLSQSLGRFEGQAPTPRHAPLPKAVNLVLTAAIILVSLAGIFRRPRR